MLRIIGELLHPIAQLRGMHTKVLRCLRIRHAALLDQANSLKLELACELPSLHDPPPVPLKHLTRCLRNRVQAIPPATSKKTFFSFVERCTSGGSDILPCCIRFAEENGIEPDSLGPTIRTNPQ